MKKGKKVAGSPDHHGSYGATGSGPFKGPIVQALFAENSGLGIKFKAASKNVVTVEQVVEDSQAARVGGLTPGMLLIGVQALKVRGYAFKQAMDLMKTAGRPLCLTFVDISKLGSPEELEECVAEWEKTVIAHTREHALRALPKAKMAKPTMTKSRSNGSIPTHPSLPSSTTPEPQKSKSTKRAKSAKKTSKDSSRPRSPTTASMFDRPPDRSMRARRARSRSTGCLDSVLDESFQRSDLEAQVAELQKLNLKLLKANFVLQNTLGEGHDDCMTDVLDAQTDKYVEYLRTLPATVTEKSKALQSEVSSSMDQLRLMLDAKEQMLMNEVRDVEKSKIERIQEEISAAITGVRSASNRFNSPHPQTLSPNSRYMYKVVIERDESLGFGIELMDPGLVVRGFRCFDDGTPGPASATKVKLGSQVKQVNGIHVDTLPKLEALLRQLNAKRGMAVEFCFDERRCFEDEGSVGTLKAPIDLQFKLTLDLSLFQEQLSVVNFEEAVSRERINLSLLRKEKEPANVIECMSRFSENIEVQRVGCCLLCNMTLAAENRQLIAESNGVPLLVNLLEHTDSAVVCAALRTVTNMCADDAYRTAVTNGVGLERITNLLDVDDNLVLGELAHTITKLCSCVDSTRMPVMHGVPACCTLIHDEFGMSIQVKGNRTTLNMTGGRRGSLAPADAVAELQRICNKLRESGLLAKLLALLFSPDNINKRTYAAKCIAVIARDEESASIVANAGAVRPLVEMLANISDEHQAIPHISSEIQISATAAIAALASNDERRIEVCNAGGLKYLTQLLSSTSGEVNLHAAWALKNVCINQHNKTVFARMKGIPPLAKLLSSTHHRVLKYSLWALAIVGINRDNSADVGKAGAIPPILRLLKSSDETIQQYAAGALMSLSTCPENQLIIVTGAGISRLVEVLSGKFGESQYDFQLCVVCTLVQVAKCKFSEKNAIAKSDGIAPIVRLISSKKDYISQFAMTTLDYLLKSYPENKSAIVVAGAVPKLLKCAASHSLEVGILAAKALSMLCDNEDAKKSFNQAAGVPCMVKLLQTEDFDAPSQLCASVVLKDVCTLDENLDALVECGGFEALSMCLQATNLEIALRENIVTLLTQALYHEKVNMASLKPDVRRMVTLAMHQAAESFSSSEIKNKSSTIVKNWKKTQKVATEAQTEMIKRYGNNVSGMFDTEDPLQPIRGAYSVDGENKMTSK